MKRNTSSHHSSRNIKLIQQPSESGFVSIFSVLIIMAVLTLIMVGFSTVTRRAQRETLDDQLNTQAYYAAESGINEAQAYLVANPNFTKSNCQTGGTFTGYNNSLDPTMDVGYTCLLVSEAKDSIIVSDVPLEGTAAAKVFPFESATLAPATFNITLKSPGMTIPTNAGYPNIFTSSTSRSATDLGVLRVDLVPTTSFDRLSLITGGYTFFLYFSTAGNTGNQLVTRGTLGQGNSVFARCAVGSTECTTTIQLDIPTTQTYMMRLSSIYSPVEVTINELKNATGGTLEFQNGQKIIDVTGKASDVFRRIQVRMPNTVTGITSTYALQTADSICKRLLVQPTNTITNDTDPACQTNN